MLPEVLSPLTSTALGAPPAPVTLGADRPPLSRLSSRQLLDRATGIIGRRVAPLLQDHAGLTAIALEAAAGIRSADPAQALRLLGPLGDVESAEPTEALWRLGRLVAASRPVAAAFDQGIEELLTRLRRTGHDGEDFLMHCNALLKRFGSQGPNGWDLMSPTWETHPDLPLAAVDRLRFVDDDDAPAARHDRLAADRRAVLAQVGAELATAVDSAGRLLAARSRSKAQLIRLLHEARMPFYEIGRRMVEQGYLERVADYAMVTVGEYPEFLDDPEAFSLVIRERRAEYEARTLSGAPADGFVGMAASGGRATGAVRILANPADPGPLQPGDIVFAPTADPSWVPLFVPAGAVVVGSGHWLTHAAVACRELGIPAVFSYGGGLAEGSIVTVDGDAGTVTVRTPVAGGRPGGS